MGFKNLTPEDKQTILEHLEALRKSSIISIVAILIGAMVSFYYNEQILALITLPLTSLEENLVVTGVTEAFFVKLKLSFLAGFVLVFPIVTWSLWRFIKPALYPQERKYFYILFPATIILFVGGVLFAYYGILRLVLKFFIYMSGSLDTMFKVDQFVSFVAAFTLPFGIIFELPVVVFFLTKMGIIRHEILARNRKYALLVIVILAAALTPGPDPISQIMMAVPVFLLYETSIWISKWTRPRGGKEKEENEE